MIDIKGYKIHKIIKHATQYSLYKGTRESDQKKVIFKVCHSTQSNFTDLVAIYHEYQILKQLNLPGIIHVEDLIKSQDLLILILEDFEGQTLKQYLTNNAIDLATFFKIAIQLVSILEELHLQQIIHKGINPNNIIIQSNSLIIKLTDFSFSSELLQETQDYSSLNLDGTLAYISPEQTGRMNRSVDYRSDFYSLGITFYEILTGQLPYYSDDPLELVYYHLTMYPKSICELNPSIPQIIDEIVFQLMAKTPEKRYKSIAGLKADLIKCQMQWESKEYIPLFKLGSNDIQKQLVISQKLYGREEQAHILIDIFEYVCQGHNRLIFVSGYSGIGKTSLIKEIIRPIVRKRGYFLNGKYDQLQRSNPYSALIEAFSDHINYFMTESEEQFSQLRSDLINALGNNGQVIVNLIPNLELIIGKQPSVADLPPLEAQNRLFVTFKRFIQAIAKPNHPLVLFLDDLQWIDNASLQLIKLFFASDELPYFLLIGAYRDNEVTINHPLMLMQQQFINANTPFKNLVLKPLKINDIENLLKDSLISSNHDGILDFSSLLLEKTNGNPFFINEFLKKIYYDKLLTFSYQKLTWKWDINQLKKLSITDNVIDLLITRIYRLPSKSQKLLELAACIGHTFNLWTLSIISEHTLAETARYVLDATKASFIVALYGNYSLLEGIISESATDVTIAKKMRFRFIHDKVQQAAYQLIPEEAKQLTHLRIGRQLLEDSALDENSDFLLEVLNHFNYTLELITDCKEKEKLSNYNLLAGKKAKISSAYHAAISYFTSGLQLISNIESESKTELYFALLRELAACQYLIGEYENAETNFKYLLASVQETLSSIEVYKLNCEMLSTLNRHEEAILLGLKVLSSVNIRVPKNPNLFHILLAIIKVKFLIGKRNIGEIILPEMESEKYQAIAALISQLLNSAFITNQNLFIMLSCISVSLSLRYGYTKSTGFTCLVYAFTVMHGLNWYQEGLKFFDLYKKLSRLYPQDEFKGKNYFVQGCFIDPWRLPLVHSIEILNKSYHELYYSGDLVYGNYCNLMTAYHAFMMGKPLSEMKQYIGNIIEFIKRTKAKDFNQFAQFWDFLAVSLENHHQFNLQQIKTFENQVLAARNITEICFFYGMATKLCFILGYYKEATHYGSSFEKYAPYSLGLVCQLEGYFYYAMSLIASLTKKSKRFEKRKIYQIHSRFKRWASWCPENYKHYLLIIEAEIARINNKVANTIHCYMQAIKSAESQDALNIAAIAYEFLGHFYLELGSQDVAKLYCKNAHSIWSSLGVSTKTHHLEMLFPQWLTKELNKVESIHSTDFTLPSIDIISLMRSTQVISSEIELDKLLHKLLIILLQNAGATRCLLLAKEDDNWYVEAEGSISEQRISLAHIEPINQRTDLPVSLILYVQRTEKSLLIQNLEEFEEFTYGDKYLSLTRPQSIMVIPILFQGQLQNILYLENRTVSMAFKQEHVQILQILSSQATISLQNARLYYQATHDSLTGLSNRNLLYQIFNMQTIKSDKEHSLIAILLIDLDSFKEVNDTLGHHFGDKLLIHTATLMKYCIKNEDIAVRLGGDEFVAMIKCKNVSEVSEIAEKFLHHLIQPILIDGHEITVTSSIGISLYPNDGETISELLKQADMALYRVKEAGKNCFQFYTSSLDYIIKQENKISMELRQALVKNELRVYYQPVYSALKHQPVHFEALVRWQHPEHGLLPAKSFISIAEKTGLIVSIGQWVLNEVLKEIRRWKENNIIPLPVAVNISGAQFKTQSISELVKVALNETNVDASYLQIEFTESVSIEYTEKVLASIAELKALGVSLTLDDFGTYYSSLSYLRENFVDRIKVDQSFVKGINTCKSDNDLVIAIIQLAHSLNLKVVAEGIETKAQIAFLEQNGIDELQGYYLSYPISPLECTKLLSKKM
ncbi:inner membrane protein [Legionella gratiana]|uniref:Inner membrane protein n=1 Tax=Legionella gratiana TaxID=45066 RepID=A0A378J9D4_9GAMM|nr:EAL domain-containing protein [Legionella gratiana]KTD11120.1 inner membrane protein [Legionella gratiana]STX44454.1 inner membrane protein PLUS sensory box protein LssE [Legionella gratiana]